MLRNVLIITQNNNHFKFYNSFPPALVDMYAYRNTDHTFKGARAQKLGLKSTYLKIGFR